MNSSLLNVSAKDLRRAAKLKERLDSLQTKLGHILGSSSPGNRSVPARRGKRRMSAAGRARIAAAARARWAKIRRARPSKGSAGKSGKPKRKMSAAGRARLSALARARWKNARALGKSTL